MQHLQNQTTISDFKKHAHVDELSLESENDLESARKVVSLLIKHLDRNPQNSDLTIEYLHRVADKLECFVKDEIDTFESEVTIECTHTISKFRKLQSIIEDAGDMAYDLIHYVHSEIVGKQHIQSMLESLKRKLDQAESLESDILYMRYVDISASD